MFYVFLLCLLADSMHMDTEFDFYLTPLYYITKRSNHLFHEAIHRVSLSLFKIISLTIFLTLK